MSLVGKLEGEVEIKASAHHFHDVFGRRPHDITSITPDKVHTYVLHEGELGKQGTLINFEYTHDGKKKVVKHLVEEIDDAKLSTTFVVKDGDLLEEYKSFKFTVQAIPKRAGSLVKWTLEYEKINANIPDPQSMLDFCIHVSKDIDDHLNNS